MVISFFGNYMSTMYLFNPTNVPIDTYTLVVRETGYSLEPTIEDDSFTISRWLYSLVHTVCQEDQIITHKGHVYLWMGRMVYHRICKVGKYRKHFTDTTFDIMESKSTFNTREQNFTALIATNDTVIGNLAIEKGKRYIIELSRKEFQEKGHATKTEIHTSDGASDIVTFNELVKAKCFVNIPSSSKIPTIVSFKSGNGHVLIDENCVSFVGDKKWAGNRLYMFIPRNSQDGKGHFNVNIDNTLKMARKVHNAIVDGSIQIECDSAELDTVADSILFNLVEAELTNVRSSIHDIFQFHADARIDKDADTCVKWLTNRDNYSIIIKHREPIQFIKTETEHTLACLMMGVNDVIITVDDVCLLYENIKKVK